MPKGSNPNSRKNLKSFRDKSEEVHKAESAKGGIASGIAKRKKAELKEAAQAWLDAEIKDKNGVTRSGAEALISFAVKRAAAGDVRAMTFLRDTAGQKPAENVNIANIKPDEEAIKRMVEKLHDHAAKGSGSNSD